MKVTHKDMTDTAKEATMGLNGHYDGERTIAYYPEDEELRLPPDLESGAVPICQVSYGEDLYDVLDRIERGLDAAGIEIDHDVI